MTAATIFYGLYQGEHGSEEDATLVGVFSVRVRADNFKELLSNEHTEAKRDANNLRQLRLPYEEIPNLYWDVRPVAFDPRTIAELL